MGWRRESDLNLRPLSTCLVLVLGATACATAEQAANTVIADIAPPSEYAMAQPVEADVVQFLVDRLAVDADQAKGGLGAILALAQQRMKPEEFMDLRGSMPDMDQYLTKLPRSSSGFQLDLASGAIDEDSPRIEGLKSLDTSFQALGMQPDMVLQFATLILQYLQQRGELAAMSSLQKALY